MNQDPRHDAIRDDLPAYALGGLSPEEARAVEEHVRGCAACREELASYGLVPHALALSAPETEPPEGARERLMQRADPIRPVADAGESSGRRAGTTRQRALSTPWVLVAASLVVAILLGGGLLQQSRRVAEQQATIDGVVDLMERADLEVKDVPTPDSEARVRIYEAREGDVGMVVVDGLPDPPEGKEYQLWMGYGGELENEGAFMPSDEGSYHKLLAPQEGFARYDLVGVEVVPEGGSEDPPSNWEVRGRL